MLSTLVVAGRTVVKRIIADWLVVGAAFITVMLATVLLASGPIYADAVTISALHRTLEDAPVTESNIEASIRIFPEFYPQTDDIARRVIDDAIVATGGVVFAHLEAESYEILGRSDEATPLASVEYFEGLANHATLVEGSWPEGAGTAVNAAAAASLGLELGDVVELANRRDPILVESVPIVGIFQANDAAAAFWLGDDLIATGQSVSGAFTSYGPFAVSQATMFEQFTPQRTDASWRVLPEFEELSVPEVDAYRNSISALDDDLDAAFFAEVDALAGGAQASGFEVQTGLVGLLADMDRSLTVTRSSVLALLIQLALLAGYALVLTAGLLVDTRRSETSLARSRGSSPGQVLGISLLEGLALTVPAVFLAPLLATALLRILNRVGPLATIGLTLEPNTNPESYALAAIAAALAIVALAWPAYRSARRFGTSAHHRGREHTRSGAQRIGVDLALLGLAVVVFWQLQTLGPEISARVRGQFGVDPLLIVAPAVALLAGAVLALRLIPLLARMSEWLARSSRATVGALASWQVARRPTRYARSALLLMLAIGIGFFAASYASTWIGSQRDQARQSVGADITLVPSRATGVALSDLFVVGAHESLRGVESSSPVWRTTGRLAGGSGLGQFLAIDATKAAEIVTIREDLSPDFDELMDTLAEARPSLAGVEFPGEPTQLRITFEATEGIPEDAGQCSSMPPPDDESETCFQPLVFVVIQDGEGVLHRLRSGDIPENEGPVTLSLDLTTIVSDGSELDPVYPLRLVNIEVQSALAARSREVDLYIGPVTVADGEGNLEAVPVDYDWSNWTVGQTSVAGASQLPAIAPAAVDDDRLRVRLETGAGFGVAPTYFSIRPAGTTLPDSFPVIVSAGFPATNFVTVGDQIRLPPLRIPNDTTVVAGTFDSFPTMDDELGESIILDYPTLQIMGYEPGPGLKTPDEYWIATDGGDDEATSVALRAPPLNSFRVESTAALTEALASDPVALGTIGALTVGFVAAAVFAAVGFAVSATVSARERLVEFALLRAVGLSPRQLGSWLALEQGALVIVSLGLGTLLGVILTAGILPLVTLTQDGGPANPDVLVIYPWAAIAGLELAVVGVLALIVVVMTILLRRVGLGSLLRLGED